MSETTLVTQGEAAALLGVTPAAVAYIARTRRLLKGYRRKGRAVYDLAEVQILAEQRAGLPKTGRPSGRELLQRRLNGGLRDMVQPNARGDCPLKAGLPREVHFTRRDDGRVDESARRAAVEDPRKRTMRKPR